MPNSRKPKVVIVSGVHDYRTPRRGSIQAVADALVRLQAPRIVYVSADPATLGRDAKRLAREGYRLIDVQPLDMEPQTPHIVSVALLTQ